MKDQCCEYPKFFFCECVGVESEGTVSVIMACTNCGTAKATKITVSQAGSKMRLLFEEKKKER